MSEDDLGLLRHHGDVDAEPGLIDFATNIAVPRPPAWLRRTLIDSLDTLGTYPSRAGDLAARRAVADRHGCDPEEVLILAGVAEGFSLLPALRPRKAVVVHPSFTEPEVMLRRAGIDVHRVILDPGDAFAPIPPGVPGTGPGAFALDPDRIPRDADLVVVGNPTNPTSTAHPAAVIERLSAPDRVVVVDEAFMDVVPGEHGSLADRRPPGTVVLRSLTKTFALAGLRIGYALGDPHTLAVLAGARPNWPVSTPGLAAVRACVSPGARAWTERLIEEIVHNRQWMIDRLPVRVARPASAPFLLMRVPDGPGLLEWLRGDGIAARRATFPGLTPDDVRVAVRAPDTAITLIDSVERYLGAIGAIPWDATRYDQTPGDQRNGRDDRT